MRKTMDAKKRIFLFVVLGLLSAHVASQDMYGPDYPGVKFTQKIFGEDRLFYGSNWPVCERAGTYARCISTVRAYFAEKGTEATENFFWRNSQVVYGWKER